MCAQMVTVQTLHEAYQRIASPTPDTQLVTQAVQFLGDFCRTPNSVPLHIELLQQVDAPVLKILILRGIIESIVKDIRCVGMDTLLRLEVCLLEELAKRQPTGVIKTLCDTIGTMVTIASVVFPEPIFDQTFRFAIGLIDSDFPQEHALYLWTQLFSTYLKRNHNETVNVFNAFFRWTLSLLVHENEEIRTNAFCLIDTVIESTTGATIAQDIDWMDEACVPLVEILAQRAAVLFRANKITDELKCFLEFYNNVFQEQKDFVINKSEMVIRTAVVAIEDPEADVTFRMCIHELLCWAASFIIECFSPDDIVKIVEVSIKLAVQTCQQMPDECSLWQSTEELYTGIMEGGCYVDIFLRAVPMLFDSGNPCEQLIALVVLKSVALCAGKRVPRELLLNALRVADADDETAVITACQLIEALCLTPITILSIFNEVTEYLLKWAKYENVFRTLGDVIKCVKKPPAFFAPLIEKLFILIPSGNPQTINELLYALGRCCARPDGPVDGLFEKLAPVLETAIGAHEDFAPVVLMCFGNLVRIAPIQIAKNLEKILEYAVTFMCDTKFVAWAAAAKMIMKFVAYLPKTIQPFLPRLVPIMVEAVSSALPETDEMRIEYNRLAFAKMQRKCLLCLAVIAREIDEYGASLGENLWKIATERLDTHVFYTKLVSILCPLLVEQGCNLAPIVAQLLNQVYPQSDHKILLHLLETIRQIIIHNTKEFALQHKTLIINSAMSAYSGVYQGFLVTGQAQIKIPGVLKAALYRLLMSVIDQVREDIGPDAETIYTTLKSEMGATGSVSQAMTHHLWCKLFYYCPSSADIRAGLERTAMRIWKAVDKYDSLYHIDMSFVCLFRVYTGSQWQQAAEGLLKISYDMLTAPHGGIPAELRNLRCSTACLWCTIVLVYNMEPSPEEVMNVLNSAQPHANTEVLPFLAPFFAWAHGKWPDLVSPRLPQFAAVLLSSEMSILHRVPEDTLRFFIAVAASIKEEQWLEMFDYNESSLIKLFKNVQRLTQ